MNALKINLNEGQKVVMEGGVPEADRTVTVLDGFGMSSFTSGTALFVQDANGAEFRVDAMKIEKLANL